MKNVKKIKSSTVCFPPKLRSSSSLWAWGSRAGLLRFLGLFPSRDVRSFFQGSAAAFGTISIHWKWDTMTMLETYTPNCQYHCENKRIWIKSQDSMHSFFGCTSLKTFTVFTRFFSGIWFWVCSNSVCIFLLDIS